MATQSKHNLDLYMHLHDVRSTSLTTVWSLQCLSRVRLFWSKLVVITDAVDHAVAHTAAARWVSTTMHWRLAFLYFRAPHNKTVCNDLIATAGDTPTPTRQSTWTFHCQSISPNVSKWISVLYMNKTIYKNIVIHHSTEDILFNKYRKIIQNDSEAIFSVISTYHAWTRFLLE